MDTLFDRFNPRWLTSTVVDLAEHIYLEKVYDKLPILGDALMDAGCDSEEVLDHCRGWKEQCRTNLFDRASWVCNLIAALENNSRMLDAVCAWPAANMPRIEYMHTCKESFRGDFIRVQMELHKLDPDGRRFESPRSFYWPEFEQLASAESRVLRSRSFAGNGLPRTHQEIWFPELPYTAGVKFFRGFPSEIRLSYASFAEMACRQRLLQRHPIETVEFTTRPELSSRMNHFVRSVVYELSGIQPYRACLEISERDMRMFRNYDEAYATMLIKRLLHTQWPGIEFIGF